MSMSICSHCQEVNKVVEISSPNSFAKVLRVIRGNLTDGTIVESSYWPQGTIKTCSTPFSEVTAKGPYQEDIFDYYFECPACEQLFELTCNTYHGSGGKWLPVGE